MSQSEAQILRQLAARLQRVLIIDQPAGARLLGDVLKDLGGRMIHVEATEKAAMAACRAIDPQIIFTELNGPGYDGLSFVRGLRRGGLNCRMAPVIVVTQDATAQTIMASRDAGVHEFLRKPFTVKDILRRLEAVTLKPRPWVEAMNYIGPDRRRFNSGDYKGSRKRKSDDRPPSQMDRIGQALKILRGAIDAIEADPIQAVRAIHAQLAELQAVAVELSDIKLIEGVATLQRLLKAAVASGRLTRADFELGAAGLWAFKPPETPRTAA
ncbi:MAG: response regulator [Caulobacteraceae bacterium]|nr:response regulator [Caulobacteraceae bacterium]